VRIFVKVVQERNDMLDGLIAHRGWIAASQGCRNTAYFPGRSQGSRPRSEKYLNATAKVQPLVEKEKQWNN